ncbi:hypothetical protein RhiXN_08088 [Rhizoctonia solani]|uniref:Uncharacterized protein n=1 Tax=Rhizoctonia solani TaxID=456999 RepID=A0A8H8SZX7_9AGAM|nr:uncharacterized protein RhiXN_08088 [Rhizoctonia solani]QRW23052.1 hypothetical protein RhiXN_08088 [Rhizoctonia solani]
MTILEAFTTEVPFSGRSDISLYRHIVDRKKTPSRPGSIIPERSILGNVLRVLRNGYDFNAERHALPYYGPRSATHSRQDKVRHVAELLAVREQALGDRINPEE